MTRWDVFHADRLELQRGLAEAAIRQAFARAELRGDDLVRPAGSALPWARLADFPELTAPPEPAAKLPHAQPKPHARSAHAPSDFDEGDADDLRRGVPYTEASDLEILADEAEFNDRPKSIREPASATPTEQTTSTRSPLEPWELGPDDLDWNAKLDDEPSHIALPVARAPNREPELTTAKPIEQPEDVFSLSRSATEKIEELDLAPMVDVAFNLVLFFMVTATTVLYKTLEIPKPSGEAPASAVAQGRSRSLDDLKKDYILVEIDEGGRMKLDREPVEPVMSTLVELLRKARERTGRTSMLLSADFATPHRNAVLAYDAANEIGLGIAIARPQPPQGPAPTLRPTAETPAMKEPTAARTL